MKSDYNVKKFSKGYRLKPETHRLISKLKKILRSDADITLNIACSKMLGSLKRNSEK